MISIYKKEINSYFNSLIGYLSIAIFLVITSLFLWFFPETAIHNNGEASLDVFFNIAPYLFMFLIPAISMRAIAGEKSEGTYELLLSRPHSFNAIVLGKYLGIVTIGLLAILPTLLYAVSVYFLAFPLGNLDFGALLGSYLGLVFLMATFSAISLFCSSITNTPIIAFLLSALTCFIAYYGLDAISQLTVFKGVGEIIQNLGIQSHYSSISRGVLTATSFFYFFSFSFLFLLFCNGHLGRDFRGLKKTLIWIGLSLIGFFILNSINLIPNSWRLDFTEDKRFTLTQTTKDILGNLNQEVHVTMFLDGKLPSGLNRVKKSSIAMLSDLKSLSKGKLTFNVINPLSGDQQEQQAFIQALLERGINPTNLNVKTDGGFSQQLIFPSAIVSIEDREISVNLLQQNNSLKSDEALNNTIQDLEYTFLSAINNITQKDPVFIGFTEGHGEPTDLELYYAMNSLMPSHQVGRVHLKDVTYESLQQLKILFIVKPAEAFTEAEKYKIDYFIRQGGRVVWAIDQVDASLENLRKTGSQPILARTLNIDDQLFLYGARLNYNLIADINCAQIPISMGNIGGQAQIELAPWYFFPILMPNSKNAMLKNLDGIRTEFIGSVDTIESQGIQKEILLSSSPFARTINSPSPISLQMVEEAPDPAKFRTKPMPVAVLLKGKFPSIFQNRPLPNGIDKSAPNQKTQGTKMIVMADGDWLTNAVNTKDQSPYPLGWDRYSDQQFANKTLLLNMVDYLLNDEHLISLRNREVKARVLDQAVVKEQKQLWQAVNIFVPLLLLTSFGWVQQWRRKKKYGF